MPSASSTPVVTQSCPMDKIPNEILHQIFQELPQRILKLVRLCCRRWSSVSTEHLFEQIYFASRSEPIRNFNEIVREPHISACVKHLVFDDTQLPKRLLKPLPHALRLPEHRAWSYSDHRAALDAFRQCYHHQQRISATSEDLTVLLQGLPHLSNLKKVSVVGGPSHLSPVQDPIGPHAQDLAETQVHASYWSYHKENKSYYEPWDSHRIQRLFQALCSAGTRLASLHIGNWQDHPRSLKMGLPLSSLTASNSIDQASFAKTAQNLFRQITELNLQIDVNSRVKRTDYNTGHYESLFQFLASMTRLTRLTFGVTQWRIVFDVFHTQRLLGNTWPDLVALKLRCVRVDPDTLLKFFTRHRNTLKTLLFHHVGFEPNTPYTWRDVAQRAGQLLRLDYVELEVYESAEDSEISGWHLESTENDLAVILGGGCDATPTSSQISDRVMTSDGPKTTPSGTTVEFAQGLRSPNSVNEFYYLNMRCPANGYLAVSSDMAHMRVNPATNKLKPKINLGMCAVCGQYVLQALLTAQEAPIDVESLEILRNH